MRSNAGDQEQGLLVTGKTSSKTNKTVEATAIINAAKDTLSVAVLFILFAQTFGLRNALSLFWRVTLLLGVWSAAAVPNVWLQLNKIKGRLEQEFELEYMDDVSVLSADSAKLNTLYLHTETDNSFAYRLLKSDGKLERKGLNDLNGIIVNKIKGKQWDQITIEDSDAIKAAVKKNGHTPMLLPDEAVAAGTRPDNYFDLKCLLALGPQSLASGFLVGVASTGEISLSATNVVMSAVLSLLNAGQNLLKDSTVIFNEHAKNSTTEFLNFVQDAGKVKGNIQPITQHAFLKRLYDERFLLPALRELSAPITAMLSAYSLYSLFPEKVKMLGAVAGVFSCIVNTSGSRVFDMEALKAVLKSAGSTFDTNSWFSRSEYVALRAVGEFFTWHAVTIDLPAKCLASERIAQLLVLGMTIGDVALLGSMIEGYLVCTGDDCYADGNGLVTSYFFDENVLDNFAKDCPYAFPIVYAGLMAALVFSATWSNISKLPNIRADVQKSYANDSTAPVLFARPSEAYRPDLVRQSMVSHNSLLRASQANTGSPGQKTSSISSNMRKGMNEPLLGDGEREKTSSEVELAKKGIEP